MDTEIKRVLDKDRKYQNLKRRKDNLVNALRNPPNEEQRRAWDVELATVTKEHDIRFYKLGGGLGKGPNKAFCDFLSRRLNKFKPRYLKLLDTVKEVKPQTIVEIGTWKGKTGKALINEALRYQNHVSYVGYDLFEDATNTNDQEEWNGKAECTLKETARGFEIMKQGCDLNFDYRLVQGNTLEVLEDHAVDFVWLDGGHSIETIRSDFDHVKNSKLVVFDDYYVPEKYPDPIDITQVGCNALVAELDNVEIFVPDGDYVGIAIWRGNL